MPDPALALDLARDLVVEEVAVAADRCVLVVVDLWTESAWLIFSPISLDVPYCAG